MRRSLRTLTIGILALAGFFAMGAAGWLRPITAPLTVAIAAVGAPLYGAGSAFDRMRIAAVTGALPDDALDALMTENAKLKTLAAENAALKDALGYTDRFTEKPILARVVSPTSDDAFHGIVIDKGADDGVHEGQPVVTGNGILVGKIASVRPKSAAVLLLSDSRSRVAVSVQNASGTVGVLEGDRGLAMTISLVPLSESLAPGDSVVTSGLEPGIRRGIMIGTVVSVTRNAQDPFQTAAVAPVRSAFNPPFVQVLTSPAFDDASSVKR